MGAHEEKLRNAALRARENLIELLPEATDRLGQLLHAEDERVQLGATKEILDRGGVGAKVESEVHVEVGLDEGIMALLEKLARQKEMAEVMDVEEVGSPIQAANPTLALVAPEPEPEPEYEDAVMVDPASPGNGGVWSPDTSEPVWAARISSPSKIDDIILP